MKTYDGCDIHPSSQMHVLMEQADKTGKAEDRRKVIAHYAEIDRVFRKQCGISNDTKFTKWSVGKPTGHQ